MHQGHHGQDEVRTGHREQVREAALLEGDAIGLLEVGLPEHQRATERYRIGRERRLDPPANRGSYVVDRGMDALAWCDERGIDDTAARHGPRDGHAERRIARARVVEPLERRELDHEGQAVSSSNVLRTIVEPDAHALRYGSLARARLKRDVEHPSTEGVCSVVQSPYCVHDGRADHLGDDLAPARRSQRVARARVRLLDLHEPGLGSCGRNDEHQRRDDERALRDAGAHDGTSHGETEDRRPRLEHERRPQRARARQDEQRIEDGAGSHAALLRKPCATARSNDLSDFRPSQAGGRQGLTSGPPDR